MQLKKLFTPPPQKRKFQIIVIIKQTLGEAVIYSALGKCDQFR